MDNEAPKYADWVPEAGGYVANGKVVSKSPLYDEGGKLRMYVDPTVFGNTQTASPQAQPTNTLVGNSGVQTANIAGSGTDANAAATSIGSNGSLNLNTANTDNSAISSPATKSNVTGDIVLNPVDKANQDYQDAIGRNDLQGAINALTELGRLTGQDYSTQIDGLRKQREQKIMGVDDQFIAQYQQAKDLYQQAIRNGDQQTAMQAATAMQQALNQQDAWREQVGYQNAIGDATARAEQELQIDFQSAYMGGINEIANTVLQLTNNYVNFQYDPTTDSNLLRAQAMVEARMRNNGAATGMIYSSTTQYAIAQATGELIPLYEKMAKEEIRESIALLQNTASFLMDLEQTQFNMWRQRIQLQLDMQAEKRAQWKQALDASNARGYVNNEEAAILGVEPGSMSQQAREHAQALQEQIDKEERELQQSIILAGYKNSLDMQKLEREYALRDWENARQSQRQAERDYANNVWDYIIAGTKGNGTNISAPTYEVSYTTEDGKEVKMKLTATQDAMGNWVDNQGNIIQPANSATTGTWAYTANKYGANVAQFLQGVYDTESVNDMDFTKEGNIAQFVSDIREDISKGNANSVLKAVTSKENKSTGTASNAAKAGLGGAISNATNVNISPFLSDIYLNKTINVVEKAAQNFGDDWGTTATGIGEADTSISNMISSMKKNGASDKEVLKNAKLMYSELFEAIVNSGNNFAFNPENGIKAADNVIKIGGLDIDAGFSTSGFGSLFGASKGDKSKEDAMVAIIRGIEANKNIPADIKSELCKDLSDQAWKFATREGASGYSSLKDRKNWKYLSGEKK